MSQSEQTVDRATDLANPDRAALLAELARVLPAEALLFADEDLKPYECDGLTAYRCLPWAVVLPQNEQQVVAAL
jgi:glycolate oxidase